MLTKVADLPEETTLRIIIEFSLALVATLVAVSLPRLGEGFFQRIEAAALRLARRPSLAVLTIGLAAPLIRLAILPWAPVPQPAKHDEFSFLLAGQTFASGRLANPTHPMWVHFETFHVDQKPTYMSMYPPAQGLILALGWVLFGQPWFGICLAAGIMCGAICWMLYGWFPPGWAMLGGALAVMRLGIFSYWVNSYFGGLAPAIGGALVLGAVPRLMRRPRATTAAILAAGAAILAASRPFEGVWLCAPVGVALLVWAWGKSAPPKLVFVTRIVLPASILLLSASFALGYYNWRVFGGPLVLPYQVNRATYAVAPVFLWQTPSVEPVYHHKVIRDFFVKTELSEFEKAKTLWGFIDGVDRKLLYVAFFYWTPMALVAVFMLPRVFRDRRMRLLLFVSGFFALSLLFNAFSAPHYLAPGACLLYAILLQAMRHLRMWRPKGEPVGLSLVRAIPVVCLLTCVLQLFFVPAVSRAGLPRASIERQLEALPGRQLVLVRYSPDRDPNGTANVEWVYNAADIDASRVVWARDMGPTANAELVDYFKDRKVWLLMPDDNPVRLTEYTGR